MNIVERLNILKGELRCGVYSCRMRSEKVLHYINSKGRSRQTFLCLAHAEKFREKYTVREEWVEYS